MALKWISGTEDKRPNIITQGDIALIQEISRVSGAVSQGQWMETKYNEKYILVIWMTNYIPYKSQYHTKLTIVTAAISTVWHWHKDRHTNQWNRIKSQEIIPCIYVAKWFLTRVPRPFNGELTFFSRNGVGKTGYPHAKEWIWSFTSYHMWEWKC